MLSWIEDGKMRLQEVYRFYNGMDQVDGHLCWDVGRLFAEIVAGMKECKKIGKIPTSMRGSIPGQLTMCFWMTRIRYWEIPMPTATVGRMAWMP